ncbi:pre-mRNA-processing factor 39 [Tothia fuscella]|uniref:Pre-mRNA-processing factor 39 n=1 Tax=Tothia fuscella TaxID=1048955 RepID=A0A9P4TYH8_9PEZI|nr:pre-mRNA-processing factor 39 [Tothia fuscella]
MHGEFQLPKEIPARETPELNFLDDEFAELKKLNQDVISNIDEYEPWDALVRAAEGLEGGLNRNASPNAIAAFREIYDRFLAKFPLFFVYWKRYADLEFHIAGTEAAEMVYERGVASIGNSVDLWSNYVTFKMDTCHDIDIIRELFERGAAYVGLDWQSQPFWNKYLEFEDRSEAPHKTFAILSRLLSTPIHAHREYFDRFRHAAQYRPLAELAPVETVEAFRAELMAENPNRSEQEIERDIRARIDAGHLNTFTLTQAECQKRAPFEDQIKRPYFHTSAVDPDELVNWRKYLDFEETEGNYERIVFLYERCVVICALYEEFWLRFARWMSGQHDKVQEVRSIFERASCVWVPITKTKVRLQYALFEETQGRIAVARDIYTAILIRLPSNLEAIIALANLERRNGGINDAIEVFKGFLTSATVDIFGKGYLVAEWATLLWKIKGSADEAREVYQKNAQWYTQSRPFWVGWFMFELQQPTSAKSEKVQYERIKGVWENIFEKSSISPAVIKDVAHLYMEYLLQRGTKDAAKEYLKVDREINGPISMRKNRLPEDGTGFGNLFTDTNAPTTESAVRLGHSVFNRYYRDPSEAVAAPFAQGFPQHR